MTESERPECEKLLRDISISLKVILFVLGGIAVSVFGILGKMK